jgi:hypothetical protein
MEKENFVTANPLTTKAPSIACIKKDLQRCIASLFGVSNCQVGAREHDRDDEVTAPECLLQRS